MVVSLSRFCETDELLWLDLIQGIVNSWVRRWIIRKTSILLDQADRIRKVFCCVKWQLCDDDE